MSHILIIGGSDAGISAALRAKEIDPAVMVTVVVADNYPNYSICGLPFYLSGEVPDWHDLAHRTQADIERAGIHLLLNQTAKSIDPQGKRVSTRDQSGSVTALSYDKLVIGTGAVSVRPRIGGLALPGVYPMRWMADALAVEQYLVEREPQSAVIIGGGYIGLEMADALTRRGLKVTVVEYFPSVLNTVDPAFGHSVQEELERHGMRVVTGITVERIEQQGNTLAVMGSHDFRADADLVLYATGVHPSTALAESAGVAMGVRGALRVNRAMETNIPDIYAAGDCVETWHRLLLTNTYLPLGTTAHKQGRVAGENAAGGHRKFAGSLGTQVVKVCDLVVAATGLREREATQAGFDPLEVETAAWDHKVYYPGAQTLQIRINGDRQTGRLLGAQMIGHRHAEIAKRIDVVAAAMTAEMTVDALMDLDLSYTPPLGTPWDAIQVSAQAWMNTKSRMPDKGEHHA